MFVLTSTEALCYFIHLFLFFGVFFLILLYCFLVCICVTRLEGALFEEFEDQACGVIDQQSLEEGKCILDHDFSPNNHMP